MMRGNIKKTSKSFLCAICFTLAMGHLLFSQESDGSEIKYDQANNTILVDSLLDLSDAGSSDNAESLIKLTRNALEIAKDIGYIHGQKRANFILGEIFQRNNEYDSSIHYFNIATDISRTLNDTAWVYSALHRNGVNYKVIGLYGVALENYFEALQLKIEVGDSAQFASTLNNIGTVFFYQENYDKAVEYYKRTYENEIKYSHKIEQATTLGNIGLGYVRMEKFEEALNYLERSYHQLDSLNEKCRLIYTSLNLAACYEDLGNFSQAKDFFQITCDQSLKCNDLAIFSNAKMGLGSIYLKENDLRLAEKSLLEAYDISEKNRFTANQQEISLKLYSLYKTKGNTDRALKFLEIHNKIFATSLNQELTEQITSMELNHQFEQERDSLEHQKETELLVLNTEVMEQRLFKNIMIAGVFVLLLVIYLIFRNYKANKLANQYLRKKNELQEQQLEIEEKSRKQLELDNNQKARALTASSIEMLNLNEKMEALIDTINQNQNIDPFERKKIIKEIGRLKSVDSQWDSIKIHFENVHPYFFERLDKYYPQLSMNDQKVLAFLKMKLSNKEIALILNVEKRTVEQSKRRLKKKLGMDVEDTDILGFIERGQGANETQENFV